MVTHSHIPPDANVDDDLFYFQHISNVFVLHVTTGEKWSGAEHERSEIKRAQHSRGDLFGSHNKCISNPECFALS
jgi:hypothetical protein